MERRIKQTAGNTIIEVLVSLALFVLFSGLFFQFLMNVHHLTGRIMNGERENQELWSSYYLEDNSEEWTDKEIGSVSFYLLDEKNNLSEERFVLPDVFLKEYSRDKNRRKIYVLELNDAQKIGISADYADEKSKGNHPDGTDSRYGAEQFDSGSSGVFSDADTVASPADSLRRSRRKFEQQYH